MSPDCTGRAAYCGDGEINGPEVCDDGINDGDYDGCATDCLSLGPRCGDGVVDGSAGEMCDDGDANRNGAGCNVDCTSSGVVLAEYWSGSLGSCTSGGFLHRSPTNPVFRTQGEILVAALGACTGAKQILVELTASLDLIQSKDVVLSQFPARAAMHEDNWIMASLGCNYAVLPDLSVDEVCSDERITGSAALVSGGDGTYLAMSGASVGRFGPGSPVVGDQPVWAMSLPVASGSNTYTWWSATFGAAEAMIFVGYVNNGSVNRGYLRRYTDAGNPAGTRTYDAFSSMEELRSSPDGGIVGRAVLPTATPVVFKLSPSLDVLWTRPYDFVSDLAVDSAGDIVVEDLTPDIEVVIHKVSAAGEERWALELEAYLWGRLSIDSQDRILRASHDYNQAGDAAHLRVVKISP